MLDEFMEHKLAPDLIKLANEIFEIAKGYGLTSYPIKFLPVSPKELNGIAAYDGFPQRMPHWTYGMTFEDIHKRHTYGQSKIYELVINTNPVIAYLLKTNSLVEQKLVMIHVCGHADFFYNNQWFKHTNRLMIDQMANNASRVRRIMALKGETRVEEFLDTCFSLDNLIDPYLVHIKRYNSIKNDEEDAKPNPKLKANEYMDRYINTSDFIDFQKQKIEAEKKKRKHFPEDPDRDILGFLVEHAEKLEQWQRDILAMIREEMYYFAPQRMTKIMNEGWATFIHSKFMTTKLATDSEIIDYCDSQSRAVASGKNLNPYRLGMNLFHDIFDRWNKGRFGTEYDQCENLVTKHEWDKKLGLGKEKIFQVRKTHNDLTFIDEFLTPEFCIENKLFSFKPNQFDQIEVSKEFEKIKSHLLQILSNGGEPVIQIVDANYENKGELKLQHVYDGQELDDRKGKDTLQNLFKIWMRPTHIETYEVDEKEAKGQTVLWSYNGKEHTKTILETKSL